MAARIAPLGMTLAFHPRAREWAPADTADPGLSCTELLLEHTPQNVTLGLDLYHSGKAGLAPDALLRRWAGRVEFVHFKDYCIAPDGSETLVPVGQGVTDWSAAVDACRDAQATISYEQAATITRNRSAGKRTLSCVCRRAWTPCAPGALSRDVLPPGSDVKGVFF